MPRKSILVVMTTALATALVAATPLPAQAVGETFQVVKVTTTGCTSGAFGMQVERANLDGGSYTVHTQVRAGGKVFMNESASISVNGLSGWNLFDNFSYGAVTNPGTWPIPEDKRLTMEFTVERPTGTPLYSWRTVVNSCNSGSIIYNGTPEDDPDGNYVPVARDRCPGLAATTIDGCPSRTLTLTYDKRQRRVVGWLVAQGFPQLFARKPVAVFKVKPGPDQRVNTVLTSASGLFSMPRPAKGKYYATSGRLVKPGVFDVKKVTSPTIRIR